jgi:CheY-like chemotaxis protein
MPATRHGPPYSILITDDDRAARETLREVLEPEGFHTQLAGSGEEALEIVRATPVHLAIFDMHMPRLTGLETYQLARQIDAVLPCILVTADASKDLMRQAFSAQVFSVIPKPVTRAIVLHTVIRALKRFHDALSAPPRATDPRESP